MRHILSNDSIKTDASKIKAIAEMKAPSNTKEKMFFFVVVNYVSKFLLKISG